MEVGTPARELLWALGHEDRLNEGNEAGAMRAWRLVANTAEMTGPGDGWNEVKEREMSGMIPKLGWLQKACDLCSLPGFY